MKDAVAEGKHPSLAPGKRTPEQSDSTARDDEDGEDTAKSIHVGVQAGGGASEGLVQLSDGAAHRRPTRSECFAPCSHS